MEIKGRDIATECYRVVHDVDGAEHVALVPERLAANLRFIGARPTHQTAYVWIADHREKIEKAIVQLVHGKKPRQPFDQITLIKER